jgi:hypothetical protein
MPHSQHTHPATRHTRPNTRIPNEPIFACNYNKKQQLILLGCEPDEPNEPKSVSATRSRLRHALQTLSAPVRPVAASIK